MGLGLLQHRQFLQLADLAIHPCANVALPPNLLEFILVIALCLPDARGQQDDLGPQRQLQKLLDNIFGTVAFDLLATLGAVWHTNVRIQQAQVVVDFRGCGHD